jgi:hypothetical protein
MPILSPAYFGIITSVRDCYVRDCYVRDNYVVPCFGIFQKSSPLDLLSVTCGKIGSGYPGINPVKLFYSYLQ